MSRVPSIHVESSTLRLVAWMDEELTVMFNSGQIYTYDNVPEKVYLEMLSAPSQGSYFYHNIRTKYTYHQVTKKDQPCPSIT